jgi:hypothetical protein
MQFEELEGCIMWWNKREGNDQAWKVAVPELLDANRNLDRKKSPRQS